MAFAVNEINKNPNLLPNITLGYHLYDNCVRLGIAFRAAMSLASGTEESFSNLNCTGPPPIIGIVGDPISTTSIAISNVLGLFRVPIVSHYATCSCLSNRKKYPSFFRTIPSDAFQVQAMVQILRHFEWTWAGLLYSDDDYGIYAAQLFQQEMQLFGHCVAFSEILPHDNNYRDIQHITRVIQASTARVVVVFAVSTFLIPLMEEVVLQNMTGRQWIASEAWATSPVYHTPRFLPFLGGTLGIAIRRGEIEGLHEFLLSLRPSNDQKNNAVRIFWENMFECSFENGGRQTDGEQVKKLCTGQEDLSNTETPYTDVSGLRAAYNVYKAVYALAHALHDLMQCDEGRGPFSGNSCADKTNLKPWQLVHYLQNVNFTTGFGDHVSFDKNGDALAIYDVLNWQPSSDGSIRIHPVGVVHKGATTEVVFTLDEDAIYWNFETKKPPRSVCSESCPPGTRQARRKGLPVCCFDCLPCGDGEISNTTNAIECKVCPHEFWSNSEKDQCVSKEVEFLSYEDPLGISLTTASLLGTCICALVLVIFAHHRNTPIHAQTMAFAINEINENPKLLPNITLGYHLYDNCVMLGMAFRAAMSLGSGTEESFSNLNCTGPPPVVGIVGDASSTPSIAISSVLGLFRVPIVSHYATCSCLSNRKKYPSFFRTIPSDAFQVRAMVQILRHFEWTWVGLLYSEDDYGIYAAQLFHQEMQLFGHCVAFSEFLPNDHNPRDIQRITGVIRASTARVVVVFALSSYLLPLMDEVVLQNMTGRQWIASEAWATSLEYQTPHFLPFLGGTLGIAIRRGEIPGLHDFLLRLHPNNDPKNNMLRIFWENMFGCSFENGGREPDREQVKKVCTGQEDLSSTNTPYTDVSELRASYNVYKAVYALAHALHDLMQCEKGRGPFSGNKCADIINLKPWQLVHYLQKVNFTTGFGDHVSFDKNGDALPIYDVLNWQPSSDGSITVHKVGVVNEGVAKGMVLTLDEDAIYWNFETKKPPRSVCSESCPPGTRQATKKGLPVCCFDCLSCGDGDVSNTTDAIECTVCPEDFWSNPHKDQCVPKEVEFLSYDEPLGISLTTASLLGTCICFLVMVIFTFHRNTPIVRANNSELSFLLLFSLKLCFLCVLLFIGQPELWTCQLRHAVFGISFVLCVSSILVKTMVVIAVFKSSRPEAYVSSPGKYAVAVEIFAILASSFGLLVAIFAPKCYIILLHPERNTKNAIMGRETQKK
ncbi:hypothetical protein QQF64_012157 [Cirrhinus molitorella]|uniref:G-protein coupled receptors family 3 profile domain-containing protein n=1 Tax=Cirrhinus molitorella TaxID=172907 RepID=A0ABR3LUL5_9TELE